MIDKISIFGDANMKRRQFIRAAGAFAVAAGFGAAAQQAWPAKSIRFIAPYPPGGTTDIISRLLAAKLQAALGQPVVVENRAGAGGNVGTDAVAKAAPDGYTVLLAAMGPISVNPTLYGSLPYDPLRDLAPVAQITAFPMVLLVANDFPAKTVAEFIAHVRAQPPGSINYASAGNGTPEHLAAEMFKSQFRLDLVHVPYKGAAAALTDLLGGRVPVMLEIMAGAVAHIKSGRLRALAVTSGARLPNFPDIPTFAELGMPEFNFTAWHGIAVPAGTPRPIVDQLNAEIRKAMQDPEVRQRWQEISSLVVAGTPEEFASLIRSETARLGKVVRDSGAKVD
jgi:tripartite-type tricarboxylate transporter receptor subunit TctC